MRHPIGQLLRSCHPEAVAAVTGLMTALALAAGRGAGTLWVTAAVLGGQLFTGWTNDYLDTEVDRSQQRLDKPLAQGGVDRRLVGIAAISALVACVPLSLASGLAAGAVHLAAVASAATYNLGLKRTMLSWLPYVLSFALLPSFVSLGLVRHHPAPLWASGAAGLIGLAGHLTQTLRDIERDRPAGIRGLPHLLGATGSAVLAAASLLAAAALVGLGPGRPNAILLAGLAGCAIMAVAITLAAVRGSGLAAFRLTLATATIVVTIFLFSGYSLAA